MTNKNILFVGPHPDDIEFGCLGTLLKHKSEGDHIIYLVISKCDNLERNKNLSKEHEKALDYVQPNEAIQLYCENTMLHDVSIRQTIRKALEKIRGTNNIDIVYSPWEFDINQDHRAVSEEVTRVFRYATILQYEIPHSCPSFPPNCFIEITKRNLKKKLKTLKMFKSQRTKHYANLEAVMSTAIFRGLQSNFNYAESFVVWRLREEVI